MFLNTVQKYLVTIRVTCVLHMVIVFKKLSPMNYNFCSEERKQFVVSREQNMFICKEEASDSSDQTTLLSSDRNSACVFILQSQTHLWKAEFHSKALISAFSIMFRQHLSVPLSLSQIIQPQEAVGSGTAAMLVSNRPGQSWTVYYYDGNLAWKCGHSSSRCPNWPSAKRATLRSLFLYSYALQIRWMEPNPVWS